MKNWVSVIIVFSLFITAASGPRTASGNDASGKKRELSRIKREMLEKKKAITRQDRKERSILAELEAIDRDIQTEKAELAEQQRNLRETEAAFREIQKSNSTINHDLVGLKQAYAGRVRALYKITKRGFSDAFFTADNLNEALKRIKYLGIIVRRDHAVIRDYSIALDRMALRQSEISQEKQVLFERKRAITFRKASLESRKRKKAVLLASVRDMKGLHEQALQELEESSSRLWAMIKKAEQERKQTKTRPGQSSAGTSSAMQRLPWPAKGKVLTHFGKQRHPQFGTMVFRRGIEIQVNEGQPVQAVNDGQVAYADWYRGYGKLVILEHSAGFYTLYGNLSQMEMEKGAQVVKGQVIGLAGETGSLRGSKLYFEVRQNGEPKDPLLWLAER